MKTPFLQQVASAYVSSAPTRWDNICFVFPNKRSATFFGRYLGRILKKSAIGPNVMTMAEWMENFDDKVIASRYEELFILYDAYKKLSPDIATQGFDQFRFWGEMLLRDFADIDMALADASMLLSNVERQKEIQSDYLTKEQRDVISLYWGESYPDYQTQGRMWKHLENVKADTAEAKFLSLWSVLSDLYAAFHQRLNELGLTTAGRRTRCLAERLSSMEACELPFETTVFVGFFNLSVAELKIFKALKALDAADFYWDVPSSMSIITDSPAWKFINHCQSNFPSRYDIAGPDDAPTECNIEILASPSSTAQTRIASQILSKWSREEGTIENVKNALDTAVVLPDESLLIEMMSLVPDEFESLNISIGLGLRLTPVAALIHDIVGLQMNGRKIDQEGAFYHESILKLVSNPLLKALYPQDCDDIKKYILRNRVYQIKASDIQVLSSALSTIFTPIESHNSIEPIVGYFKKILEILSQMSDDTVTGSVSRLYCEAYMSELDKLHDTISRYDIDMGDVTFLQMLERTINSSTIHFKGEPLQGLQIVGMLETRNLDFKNLIILSMNERIYPRKFHTASFIPENIRHGYGLPTIVNQEAVSTYNFYRLLTRAQNVCFIYDSRTIGANSGDMSRYLVQLLYLQPQGIKLSHRQYNFKQSLSERRNLSLAKDDHVLEMLGKYMLQESEDARRLSASALSDYISCQLKFYIQDVEKISLEEDTGMAIDSGSYGSIVHSALQLIYQKNINRVITESILDKWIKQPQQHIEPFVTQAVNKEWYHLSGEGLKASLEGEVKILAELIAKIVARVLEQDKQFAPLKILGTEQRGDVLMEIGGKNVNFRYIIDRIDRIHVNLDGTGGTLRIVDYKTGPKEKLSFTSVESLFNPTKTEDNQKGIRQLLIYCLLYRQKHPEIANESITPYIYKLSTIFKDDFRPLQSDKQEVKDLDFADEVRSYLEKTVEAIFSTEGENACFRATTNDDHCTYCSLKTVCNRVAKEN